MSRHKRGLNKSIEVKAGIRRSRIINELFIAQIDELNLGVSIETEFRFHPTRRWRFDIAIPKEYVAFEIEGGIYQGYSHGSVRGIMRDIEKYNEAQLYGWAVYRVTPQHVSGGEAKELASKVLSYLLI